MPTLLYLEGLDKAVYRLDNGDTVKIPYPTENFEAAAQQAILETAIKAAIESDVKTLMLGNVHMLNWADLIIPQAAYAVNRIVYKTDPVEAHTNTVALLNGTLADQYDPQRRFWQNFCYTVWCGNFDYYLSNTWVAAYSEVATDIGINPVSRGAIARTFRAMQPFVSVNAMQMLFPALAKLIAPELLTP